jgi:transposase-like protein
MHITLTKEFKRQIACEILSGTITTAAICRQYSIAYPIVAMWKKDYTIGRLDNNSFSVKNV